MTGRILITVDKHDDGTISYWCCGLNAEETDAYDTFVDQYSHKGWSTRGDMNAVLDELKEVLADLQPWA